MNPSNLMGPDKASQRMQELQARIQSYSPPPPTVGFSAALKGAIGKPGDGGLDPASPLPGLAIDAANQNGVDPGIFKSLVNAESSWNPQSVSNKGAIGLTQLMPDTAKGLGITDPYDPVQNLQGGAKYLRQMLDKFGGNYTKALAAYNAGPGAVEKANGVPPYQETVAYVRKILSHAASNP
jgi:soluble lytic murein transglycosylase-like protein